MLQCECELISQSALSFSLERQAAAVRKFEQWTLVLADKAALMSSWRDASDNFTKQASPVKTSGLQEERGYFPATELYSEIFKQVQLAIAKVATAVGNRFDTAVLQTTARA